MSGWDWLHAGLEIATFAKAQSAQKQLSQMTTAAEIEAARRALLEAMRSFVFDISRDIQLAEEQIAEYPQQVYIVSKSLALRLSGSGLSPELFPDIVDKEYFFQTEKKIAKVVQDVEGRLSAEQIQDSDTAVKYVSELPLLQRAISAKSAQESLRASDERWREMSRQDASKMTLRRIGIAGLVLFGCAGGPVILGALGLLSGRDFDSKMGGLLILGIAAAIVVGSIYALSRGGKSRTEFTALKNDRELWQKQLMSPEDWGEVRSAFGELSSQQYRRIYDERLAYLQPLLGGDFQKYLTTGE